MKKIIFLLFIIGLISCNQMNKQKPLTRLNYPETRKSDVTDVYFGTNVADPYRWLEDDNSEETKEWVKKQNEVTFSFLNKIPFREKIKTRLTKIWDYPKISAPFRNGGRWFVSKNDGLQNQNVIYLLDKPGGEEKLFLDPNTLSEDGTVSLANFDVSDDGRYAAYGVSRGGSDWKEFFIRDIETGEDLKDHILWAKFSGISWLNNGFFYSRYPEPDGGAALSGVNENSKVYFHKIGDDQSMDKLIYEDTENPQVGFGVSVSEDLKILSLYKTESTSGNALAFMRINSDDDFIDIITDFEDDYSVIDHHNGNLYVLTNNNASNYRLISISTDNPDKANWKDIIPQQEEVLSSVSVIGGKLIAHYMKDAHDISKVFDMEGNYLYDIDYPLIGSVSGFGGRKEDTFTYYTLSSYITPSIIYKYDVINNVSELYQETEIDFDASVYETKQIFYESKDGTKVPMYIMHKKGLEMDGNNPTLLYGYGGFNISLTPRFSIRNTILLENGGVFAVANLRGGGEYGENWHKEGTLLKKQNVFDDFIAAAEYLINEKYTSKDRLAILGGSNGGLLIGAVINQRPDLFKVALPAVGVMDMLRYHKFTIGRYWATDYGTSEDSEEMFKYLLSYSPLHTIRPDVDYPAVMVTTADHDDRVVPAHSFKYIATLQEKYKGNNPVLIRIESDAGHGAGTPTAKYIEEYTDMWSFVFYIMGITPDYN